MQDHILSTAGDALSKNHFLHSDNKLLFLELCNGLASFASKFLICCYSGVFLSHFSQKGMLHDSRFQVTLYLIYLTQT